MRYCFVKQDGIKDCGVACLLMLIKTYKGNATKEYLRELTHTTKDGTTAYDLMKAGEKFHFTTYGVRGKIEDLEEDCFPVIAHVIKDEIYQHFVVIYQFNRMKNELVVADPATCIQKMSVESFQKISTEQFIIFKQNTVLLKIEPKHPLYTVLKNFFYNHKKHLTMIFILSFLYMIFSIVITFCLQFFIDYVIHVYNTFTISFVVFTFLFIIFAGLKGLFQYIRLSFTIQITHELDFHLFENIYHHLFLLPDSYYQNRTTGELLARITDLINLKSIMSKFLLDIAMDSFLAFVSLFILFLLSPKLTVLLLVFVGLDIILFLCFHEKLKRKIQYVKESYAKFHSYLVDTIEAISSIRHLGRETYIEKRFKKCYQKYQAESIGYQKCWNWQFLLKNLIHGTSHVLLIAVGCYLIYSKQLNVSTLMSYLFLSSFFLNPIESIYEFLLDFQDGREAFRRIEEFYQVEEKEKKTIKKQKILELEVRNLNCSYRRGEPVLVDFTQKFIKGEKVLIYGKSGCGKSTFIQILSGYMNQYEGSIWVNRQKLLKNNPQFLRETITYVSQDETLLNMSLKENIIMGREISEEKFVQICNLLQIQDFVSKHVLTYDMPIEENGNNLSGGERQRIILARSILKESDVYIFDESLCNMDVALERQVLKNLFKYLRDKLVIVVSHRFYNEDLYDRKIHLEKGGAYAENHG